MERWKEVAGLNGYYSISTAGRVRSNDRTIIQSNGRKRFFPGVIKTPNLTREGYLGVNMFLNSKAHRRYIHRMVAEAFIPNPKNKKQVNHKDGNKQNNSVENLEWSTPSENCRHAIDTGIYQHARGEASGASKITESDVIEIRRLASQGMMHKDIAEKFPIGRKAVTKIVRRQRWSHVND